MTNVVVNADFHVQSLFLADDVRHLLTQLPQRAVGRVQPGMHRHQLRNVRDNDLGIALPFVLDGKALEAFRKYVQRLIAAGADPHPENDAVLLDKEQYRRQAPPGIRHGAEQVIHRNGL